MDFNDISSITRTSDREREFGITLSDPYFCTSYALIYRAGTPVGSVREAVAGKKIGVQQQTTSFRLAEAMAAGGPVRGRLVSQHRKPGEFAARRAHRFRHYDTSFARAAQLDTRLGNGMDRLELKEILRDNMPESMKDAYK
ncbi:MAG: hypothetical protein ACREDO_00405 [Methyloceanibacter sp.]